MVKVKIIATGDEKDKNIKALTAEFYKRLSRWCKCEEVFVSEIPPKSDAEISISKKKESELQLSKIEGFVVALDRTGKMLDSLEIARTLDNIQTMGNSTISFMLGGSNGFDESVLKRADLVLSFGKITLPHELARLVLVEQIYRAFTINNNKTYHK